MIATGGYYRGPELKGSQIDRMLRAVGEALDRARGGWKEGDAPAVVVLFIVPGSLGDASFSGQRTTLFSRKKKLLQIEAAVPKEALEGERVRTFVLDALRQASQTAAEHFARKKAGVFDLAKAGAIIQKVEETLSPIATAKEVSANKSE